MAQHPPAIGIRLRRFFTMLASVVALVVATAIAAAEPAVVDSGVADEVAANGSADFWILFDEEADTSAAPTIDDRAVRGAYVYQQLTATARRSQAAIVAELERRGVSFESFWIVNAILVRGGDGATLNAVRSRAEVDAVRATAAAPSIDRGAVTPRAISAEEWNLAAIRAPQVWSTFGVRGEGIIVATIDTGVQFNHPALVGKYRGNLGGGSFDHNYNWFDPTGTCSSPAPCDDVGRGTHTTGVMVGDDGAGNQVGVAPGARWIAARGCTTSGCSDSSLLAVGQWILAPTDLNGNNPRPDLRADIVSVGWSVTGNNPFYQAIINAWAAAGIFSASQNGDGGPACGTSGSPADYTNAYSVGAFDSLGAIATFSARGPSPFGGEIKPNIAAPGVTVRSSVPGGSYGSLSTTAVAAAHVAATAALMWSAAPAIRGDLAQTRAILDDTAVDVSDLTCGGTVDDNNIWGQGKLDAFAAVEGSPRGPVGILRGTVTDASAGTPIGGATVQVTNRSQSTLADGTYSFTLPVGDYVVFASAAGHATENANVAVNEGNVSTLDFQLVPVLTPTPTPTPTVTPTPTPTPTVTPTPNGFVPPDNDVLGCEKTVAKALTKLGACLRNCRVKAATAAVKGRTFDQVACATGTPKKSCRAKFDATSQRVLDKGICPPCLDGARQAALADRVTVEVESETADLYCEGTVPLP